MPRLDCPIRSTPSKQESVRSPSGERKIGRLKTPDLRAGGIRRPLASYQPDDDKQNHRADDGSDDVANNSPAE